MYSLIIHEPYGCRYETFDFNRAPGFDQITVDELATCHFIAAGTHVIFAGGPGTGKSHIAHGIANGAVAQGYTAGCLDVCDFVRPYEYRLAEDSGQYDLLIVENAEPSQDLNELLATRKNQSTLVITTCPADQILDSLLESFVSWKSSKDREAWERAKIKIVEFNHPSY